MGKLNEEYFKHKFECYKHLFTISSAIIIGCIAWFVTNFGKAYTEFLILDVLVVLSAFVGLMITAVKVRKYIKLLRE